MLELIQYNKFGVVLNYELNIEHYEVKVRYHRSVCACLTL